MWGDIRIHTKVKRRRNTNTIKLRQPLERDNIKTIIMTQQEEDRIKRRDSKNLALLAWVKIIGIISVGIGGMMYVINVFNL